MNELFHSKEAKRQKLRELLKNRERGFKTRLAKYCGVDPRTVHNWTKEGGAWPVGETEKRLWECFREVEEDKLTVRDTSSDSSPTVFDQLRELIAAEATDPEARKRLATIKALVQQQIEGLLRVARGE